jgi:hypothetical protein
MQISPDLRLRKDRNCDVLKRCGQGQVLKNYFVAWNVFGADHDAKKIYQTTQMAFMYWNFKADSGENESQRP